MGRKRPPQKNQNIIQNRTIRSRSLRTDEIVNRKKNRRKISPFKINKTLRSLANDWKIKQKGRKEKKMTRLRSVYVASVSRMERARGKAEPLVNARR